MFTYQSLEFLYRVIDCPAIARVALLETVGKRVLSIADGKRHNLRGQSRGAKITLHSREEYTTVKGFFLRLICLLLKLGYCCDMKSFRHSP